MKIYVFWSVFWSHKIDTPVCEFNFGCQIWRAEIQIWFPVTSPKIFKEWIKNNVFFRSKYVIFHHFSIRKIDTPVCEFNFWCQIWLAWKSASRGVRTHARLQPSFSGHEAVVVTTPPRPRLRVKGVRIAMMCRRTVSKIDDFSSKLIVKKSTRRLCNGSETTRKTHENRSFFVEIACQKINTLVLQLRAASTSYAKLQNLVVSKSVLLTRGH